MPIRLRAREKRVKPEDGRYYSNGPRTIEVIQGHRIKFQVVPTNVWKSDRGERGGGDYGPSILGAPLAGRIFVLFARS